MPRRLARRKGTRIGLRRLSVRQLYFRSCLRMVLRGGIEPPTRGFSVCCLQLYGSGIQQVQVSHRRPRVFSYNFSKMQSIQSLERASTSNALSQVRRITFSFAAVRYPAQIDQVGRNSLGRIPTHADAGSCIPHEFRPTLRRTAKARMFTANRYNGTSTLRTPRSITFRQRLQASSEYARGYSDLHGLCLIHASGWTAGYSLVSPAGSASRPRASVVSIFARKTSRSSGSLPTTPKSPD